MRAISFERSQNSMSLSLFTSIHAKYLGFYRKGRYRAILDALRDVLYFLSRKRRVYRPISFYAALDSATELSRYEVDRHRIKSAIYEDSFLSYYSSCVDFITVSITPFTFLILRKFLTSAFCLKLLFKLQFFYFCINLTIHILTIKDIGQKDSL